LHVCVSSHGWRIFAFYLLFCGHLVEIIFSFTCCDSLQRRYGLLFPIFLYILLVFSRVCVVLSLVLCVSLL
jgi:hypothetical protein